MSFHLEKLPCSFLPFHLFFLSGTLSFQCWTSWVDRLNFFFIFPSSTAQFFLLLFVLYPAFWKTFFNTIFHSFTEFLIFSTYLMLKITVIFIDFSYKNNIPFLVLKCICFVYILIIDFNAFFLLSLLPLILLDFFFPISVFWPCHFGRISQMFSGPWLSYTFKIEPPKADKRL